MPIAAVLVHHIEFDRMIRLESFLFPKRRLGAQSGIVDE